MSLPATIRVKLSSEAAEYISLTPVVVQEMPVRDLVEHMLGVTGKDEARVRDLLQRGTLVSGASRFRWTGLEADAESIRALFSSFPDPDPARPFSPARCVRAVLRGARQPIVITRETARRRGILDRMLGRPSFWDVLVEIAVAGNPRYSQYSYRDRADLYQLSLDGPSAQRLRERAHLVRYNVLEDQIRSAPAGSAELYVVRTEVE
ncbi:MAG TPA: hypothetical protein VEU62_22625 [Bryobacterales bacterium]|nr:hypothetical protein [Bryobacterales bacterium]